MGAGKLLAVVTLGAATADIYVPKLGAGQVARIDAIWIANNDTVARGVTIQHNAAVLGVSKKLTPASAMNANEAAILSGRIYLSFGDKLEGKAAAAAVVDVHIYGEEPAT